LKFVRHFAGNRAVNRHVNPLTFGNKHMSQDSSPVQIVAQSPIRAPLAGGIPWSNHADHPAVAGFAFTTDAQIRTIPAAVVDAAGGPTIRRQ
jgi:hypothetical protein